MKIDEPMLIDESIGSVRAVSIEESIEIRKKRLELELADLVKAIEIMERNPESLEFLQILRKLRI